MKERTKVIPNTSLKCARERRFFSQLQLANAIDTTPLNVSRWERGLTTPSLHFRQKLCQLFEKSAQELGFVQAETEENAELSLFEEAELALLETALYDPAIPLPSSLTNDLLGRDEMLQSLKQQFCTQPLLALSGLPGVGKTTLAVELVHDREVLKYFSDGILWANLGRQPHLPGLFSRWSKLLGISPAETARVTDPLAWASIIHAAIGMRHMLLIIDDAWTLEDAMTFKIGGPNCVHLLTTRFPDIALQFAPNDAIVVHELSAEDSVALLTRVAPEVVTAEPEEVQALIQSVGGLPLALTLMGKYLQTQAHSGQPRRLHAALERLHCAEERLKLTGLRSPVECSPSLPSDTPLSLQAAIDVSDQQLDEQSQSALRALSAFPAKPNDFSEEAALSVCNVPVEALDRLTDAGLLEGRAPGRYMLHQTIADYARVHQNGYASEERLVTFFIEYVEAHTTDFDALETETCNVLAAIEAAFRQHMSAALVRGVISFAPFLEARGLYSAAEAHLSHAKEAALADQNEAGLAAIWLHLGRLAQLRGDFDQAEQSYQLGLSFARKVARREIISALLAHWGEVTLIRGDYGRAQQYLLEGLSLARELGQNERIAILLKNLGEVADSNGDYERGETLYQEGLALARAINDREIMSALLQNLGVKAFRSGDYALAEQFFAEGLDLAQEIGHPQRASAVLMNLGALALRRGQFEQAEALSLESLSLARAIGSPIRISSVLQNLGLLASLQNKQEQAEAYLRESLQIARDIGHRWLISETLIEWGEHHLRLQQIEEATTALASALATARSIGASELIASSLFALARANAASGNLVEARAHAQESHSIFHTTGHEKAAAVAAWLHIEHER